jgi:hypothetical protein
MNLPRQLITGTTKSPNYQTTLFRMISCNTNHSQSHLSIHVLSVLALTMICVIPATSAETITHSVIQPEFESHIPETDRAIIRSGKQFFRLTMTPTGFRLDIDVNPNSTSSSKRPFLPGWAYDNPSMIVPYFNVLVRLDGESDDNQVQSLTEMFCATGLHQTSTFMSTNLSSVIFPYNTDYVTSLDLRRDLERAPLPSFLLARATAHLDTMLWRTHLNERITHVFTQVYAQYRSADSRTVSHKITSPSISRFQACQMGFIEVCTYADLVMLAKQRYSHPALPHGRESKQSDT